MRQRRTNYLVRYNHGYKYSFITAAIYGIWYSTMHGSRHYFQAAFPVHYWSQLWREDYPAFGQRSANQMQISKWSNAHNNISNIHIQYNWYWSKLSTGWFDEVHGEDTTGEWCIMLIIQIICSPHPRTIVRDALLFAHDFWWTDAATR